MAEVILKVKVMQGYKDAETQEWREPNDVLDMTPDRYAEAVASLARWPGKFLEVIAATGADVQAPADTPPEPPAKEPDPPTPPAEPAAAPEPPAPAAEKEPAKGKAKK